MKLHSSTQRGISNWENLSLEEQYEGACWLADAIHRNNALNQISPDMVGVAAGPRECSAKGGAKRSPENVVLVVDVTRKKTPRKCGQGMVPDRIQAKVSVGGSRRVLSVPTDIRKIPRAPTAQADPFRVKARSRVGNPSVHGSICALVKNTSGNLSLRYVLTCHHVAFLSLHDPNLEPDRSSICAHMNGIAIDSEMGKSTRPAKFSTTRPFSIDGGLVRLTDSAKARYADFWPTHPQGWIKKSHQIGTGFRLGCRIFNKRLNGVRTEFSALRFGFPVEYEAGGVARFSQLIEYHLPDHFTRAGDSGGALIARGKILVGMHIAGAGKKGYAIPAYHLLRSSAFSPSLELAEPKQSLM